jgi:hypothetical protein
LALGSSLGAKARATRVALIMLAPVAGADEPGQESWPSRVSVVEEQGKFLSNRPDGMRYDVDLLVDAG